MNGTQVTVIGNVATEVAYTLTPGGVPVANFRLASTERRFDRARELWVDGETQWLTVTAWRSLAGHLIDSLTKGDPVVVSGRLRVREWAEGEAKRSRVEIDARSVGHDLSRGTARFSWAPGGRAGVPEEGAAAPGRPSARRCPGGSWTPCGGGGRWTAATGRRPRGKAGVTPSGPTGVRWVVRRVVRLSTNM